MRKWQNRSGLIAWVAVLATCVHGMLEGGRNTPIFLLIRTIFWSTLMELPPVAPALATVAPARASAGQITSEISAGLAARFSLAIPCMTTIKKSIKINVQKNE